jgi:hemolysin III
LAAGGLAYTVGALVYARRWPDPSPRIFGYHELFHVFVVVGTALHFSLVAIAVL